MNTPVNFSTAKLLKEKGFDNESAHYYNEEGEMLFDINFPSLQPTKPDVYYDNPTIAEVVMWLYEKRGIWIEVKFLEAFKVFYFELTNVNNLKGLTSKSENHFNSPTEAYSAAIEYILKNLI